MGIGRWRSWRRGSTAWCRRGSWRRWGTCGTPRPRPTKVGRLHRVHRGVYARRASRALLARALHGGGARLSPSVASHWSAAWLWGLLRSRPGTIHVTCPGAAPLEAPVRHTPADLPRSTAPRDGIPVTSLARTILDIARRSRRADRRGATSSGPTRPSPSTCGRCTICSTGPGDIGAGQGAARRSTSTRGARLHPLRARAAVPRAGAGGGAAGAGDELLRRRVRDRRLVGGGAIRGRTRRLRDARVAALLRGRSGSRRRVAARRDRDHPGDRAAARSRTGRGGRSVRLAPRRQAGPRAPLE